MTNTHLLRKLFSGNTKSVHVARASVSMKTSLKIITLFSILVFSAEPAFAESKLQIAYLGDYTTTSGEKIDDLKVAYRTVGVLNADKSNVVLWPTWYTGTSEKILSTGILANGLDTSGLFIILVDALANGVSSSPSNTSGFPDITIRDMVNSQHTLLVDHLGINKLRAIIGVSMGGMQALEWVLSYPNFMDKAISIIGTPKQSSYDLLVWQTQIDLLTEAGTDKDRLNFALRKSYDIVTMNLTTPADFASRKFPDGIQKYLKKRYENMMDPMDYLATVKAMVHHDIYESTNNDFSKLKSLVKADILIIVSDSDHLVNPLNALKFAQKIQGEVLVLTGDNGHMAPFIQTPEMRKAISAFLN